MEYQVILFYYFKKLNNIDKLLEEHKTFCDKFDFRGRIILSTEGINATLSGKTVDVEKYIQYVKDIISTDIDFKIDIVEGHTFDRLTIKHKPEIIKVGKDDIRPYERTGIHLEPREFKAMMDEKDSIVVDMRSNHEHKLGYFKDAVRFDINRMYELPEVFAKHPINKPENYDKPILTYCTGGIKCEKATSYLLEKGFKNVYQLHGGIIKYGKEMKGEDFLGRCYVFDKRLAVDVNSVNPKVISKCYGCGEPCDTMVNCMKTTCNRHTTMCAECYTKWNSTCSAECSTSPTRRKNIVVFHEYPYIT